MNANQKSVEEAARRMLEGCGATAGVPCMIVALDDVFVVPEQDAVNDALGNCVKRDSDCRVIAIGPFSVGLNP